MKSRAASVYESDRMFRFGVAFWFLPAAVAISQEKSRDRSEQGISAATCSAPKRWRSKLRSENCNRLQRLGRASSRSGGSRIALAWLRVSFPAGENPRLLRADGGQGRLRRCP